MPRRTDMYYRCRNAISKRWGNLVRYGPQGNRFRVARVEEGEAVDAADMGVADMGVETDEMLGAVGVDFNHELQDSGASEVGGVADEMLATVGANEESENDNDCNVDRFIVEKDVL